MWGLRWASGWGEWHRACRLTSLRASLGQGLAGWVRRCARSHLVHCGGRPGLAGRLPGSPRGPLPAPSGPLPCSVQGRGAFIWHRLPAGYLWAAGHLGRTHSPRPAPPRGTQRPSSVRAPLHTLIQPQVETSHGVMGGVINNAGAAGAELRVALPCVPWEREQGRGLLAGRGQSEQGLGPRPARRRAGLGEAGEGPCPGGGPDPLLGGGPRTSVQGPWEGIRSQRRCCGWAIQGRVSLALGGVGRVLLGSGGCGLVLWAGWEVGQGALGRVGAWAGCYGQRGDGQGAVGSGGTGRVLWAVGSILREAGFARGQVLGRAACPTSCPVLLASGHVGRSSEGAVY